MTTQTELERLEDALASAYAARVAAEAALAEEASAWEVARAAWAAAWDAAAAKKEESK